MSGRSKEGAHVNDLLKQLCQQQLSHYNANSAEVTRAYQQCCRMLDSKPFTGDEHQIHDAIRKKLVSAKGYNVQHNYTDCYDKLSVLDGPKNRAGLLHFLLLLSNSKSKSDTVALMKPSAYKQHDISTGPPARIIPNRELVPKSRDNSLVTPRYAAAVLSTEHFDGYSEADLVRDLLFVCQGIETSAIRWDASRMCYVPRSLLPLPKNKLDLACKIAELGFLYKQIKGFIQQRLSEKSYGLIGQAFCSAITLELKEYYRLLAVLENQNAAGKLSLHRLLVWSHDTFDRLRLLTSLCAQAGYLNGGALASCLHTFLQYGDPTHYNLVNKVLHLTTLPLGEMLRRWIYEGECNDVYGEFFIEVDSDMIEDMLWESKYKIRDTMLPSFIPKQMAERILLIGKTINFIRVVCRDHTPINFPFSTVATNTQGLNDIVGPELHNHISEVDKTTSQHLIDLLKKKYLLCEHLTAIRDYLLLGQGDFIQHLIDLISKDLSLNAADVSTSMLQSKLETAQRATNAQYHDYEVIRRVNVIKLEESLGDTGWDVFTVDYEINGPLSVIINQDSRETYLCIFRMLWKTKRIEHGLRKIWGRTMLWDRSVPLILPDILEFRHLVNMTCNEIQHFISQVQYYINFEVLECSWKELETAVNTAADLDCIIEAHKQFVNLVSERLMLSEEHKDVLSKLYAIFMEILVFMNHYDNISETLKKQNTIREQHKRNIDTRTKKGGWGTNDSVESNVSAQNKTFVKELSDISVKIKDCRVKFSEALTSFLLALAREPDDAMKFLSLRLDFNEYYKSKNVQLSASPYINKTRSVVVN